jgi:hypothetical protein
MRHRHVAAASPCRDGFHTFPSPCLGGITLLGGIINVIIAS